MKTLVSCNPIEFMVQTGKIRNRVKDWLTITKIMEIRKRLPKVEKDATKEELKSALSEQIKKNWNAILDAMLDDHPVETAELLGMICFIEPEDIANHEMREIFKGAEESLSCPEVIGFFTSLMQLVQTNTSAPAKASD